MDGWIKLHRRLLDNSIASKPKWAWVWIVLLLSANHEEHRFIYNGKEQVISRGQLLTGRKELSKITKMKPSTLEDVLSYLENSSQIRQQKTNKFRIITVINYDEYQKSDNKATTKRQQSDTNKNEKNVRRRRDTGVMGVNIPLVAKQTGVSLEVATQECARAIDYAKSKGKTYKDYNAYVRNWIRGRDRFKTAEKKSGGGDWITDLVRNH